MEQAPRLYRCPGMWSISHHRTWREHGKFGVSVFFFFLALCILCLFCDGHETRTQAHLLLRKAGLCRTCLRHDGRAISFFFFFRTMAGWGDPWGRGYPSITGEGLRRIKPRRASGCLWNLENHPACSLWGLRKFHVRVRSPHFSCRVCP